MVWAWWVLIKSMVMLFWWHELLSPLPSSTVSLSLHFFYGLALWCWVLLTNGEYPLFPVLENRLSKILIMMIWIIFSSSAFTVQHNIMYNSDLTTYEETTPRRMWMILLTNLTIQTNSSTHGPGAPDSQTMLTVKVLWKFFGNCQNMEKPEPSWQECQLTCQLFRLTVVLHTE